MSLPPAYDQSLFIIRSERICTAGQGNQYLRQTFTVLDLSPLSQPRAFRRRADLDRGLLSFSLCQMEKQVQFEPCRFSVTVCRGVVDS